MKPEVLQKSITSSASLEIQVFKGKLKLCKQSEDLYSLLAPPLDIRVFKKTRSFYKTQRISALLGVQSAEMDPPPHSLDIRLTSNWIH